MDGGSYSLLPGGNISPSRFVKTGTTQGTAVQCSAVTDHIYGISQPGTRNYPLTGLDDGYAGISGDGAINIFGPGDDACPLAIGGTVAYGDYLTTDSNGRGVTSTTNKDNVGAVAMQAGVSGDIIKVKPIRLINNV